MSGTRTLHTVGQGRDCVPSIGDDNDWVRFNWPEAKERERDRQTDRQAEREREREIDRVQTDRVQTDPRQIDPEQTGP